MPGKSFLYSLIALVPYVLADSYVVHEQRATLPRQWSFSQSVSAQHAQMNLLPMRIGLAQNNLDRLDDMVMRVSDPLSPHYSDHYSAKEIVDTFAPTDDSIRRVREWIVSAGVSPDSIRLSLNKGWIEFEPTIAQAEELLRTKYHTFEHSSGHTQVACEQYSVPKELSEHIDLIMPTLHFDARPEQRAAYYKEVRDVHVARQAESKNRMVKRKISAGPSLPREQIHFVYPPANAQTNTSLCNSQISPACLQALYKLPHPNKVPKVKGNTFGIVEYEPNYMYYPDLDTFANAYLPGAKNYQPTFKPTNGAVLNQTLPSDSTNATIFYDAFFGMYGEGNLDFQFALLSYPAIPRTQYFQVGAYNLTYQPSFNNFLDAIDRSYCTFQGGDDPNFDTTENPQECGEYKAPLVLSTSYGYNELDLTPRYEKRQCAEYAKLGMHGTTFFFSSGDNGVAGNGDQCINPGQVFFNSNYTEYNNGTFGIFNPSFPPTCPYVTAVGATSIPYGGSVKSREVVADSYIISGGGFSNVFPLPSYQKSAVRNYLRHMPAIQGAASYVQYNNSGHARAYPDISANGLNYTVSANGSFILVGGTSASAPVSAAIFSLLNAERLHAKKKPIGFLNPVLYAHPSTLNDIVSGSNPGCGTSGFFATKGWDPATGLGTPNYPALSALFKKLR